MNESRTDDPVRIGAAYTSVGERNAEYDYDEEEFLTALFSAMEGTAIGVIYGLSLEELVPLVNCLIRHARYLAEKEGRSLRLVEEEDES